MPSDDYVKREDIFPAVTEIEKEIVFGGQDDDKVVDIINSIPAADVEPKRKWIPVTDADNLPKKSTPCLVACNQWGGDIVRKATYLDSEKRFYEGKFDITEYVTHWMPSPEPPKEEDDAEVH